MADQSIPPLSAADFGRGIRIIRQDRGLRLKQLAALAGVSDAHLCRIEHGQQEPGVTTADRIVVALGAAWEEVRAAGCHRAA